ncbi:hypothetical protein FJQ54_07230 [Sandaracinobacter neustonicus]|uniref:Core-binding (CB) domain-containing protein n=1 Tax=Sandaracinobacter neustonicus TaxID=1715348 RepID=A0A501XQD0_9SPHN|nr:hypothetical protein [Sandaracinobacter neustonicus]TPE62307.1 hypothetical protein FJQ54_07230 [Sandaracinobacter neustonicus]
MIAWKDYLLRPVADGGKGLSQKTVRDGYLATTRALFAWAAMNRKVESNPVQGFKVRVVAKPKVRDRAFTDDEANKVLAATLLPEIISRRTINLPAAGCLGCWPIPGRESGRLRSFGLRT